MSDRQVEVAIAPEPGPGGIVTDRRGMAWQNALSDDPRQNVLSDDPRQNVNGVCRMTRGPDGSTVQWDAVWVPCFPGPPTAARPEAMTWPVLATLEGPLTVRWEGGEAVRWNAR